MRPFKSFASRKASLSNRKRGVLMAALACGAVIESLESRMLMAAVEPLDFTTTWVGNSGGQDILHVMHSIGTMYVGPDGKVYLATTWEEGGANVQVYNTDGTVNPKPVESGTGSWWRMSNGVTTGQGSYVYQSLSQALPADATGGTNTQGGPTYPAPGATWQVIRRYNSSTGFGAPWTGAAGYDGSMLITTAKSLGLAVYNNEIYSAEEDGRLRVYNATTMSTTAVRSWAITNPGTLAADSIGSVWMLDTTQKKLVRYSTTGALRSQQINLVSYTPNGFGIDLTNNKIYVANGNADQNVLIYNNITTTPAYSGTFGTTGGIFSGSGATIGTAGALRFNRPVGVGVDSSGNIYVACDGSTNMGGAVIEKYSAAGVRQWVKYGLNFVDMADISPASETDIYTVEEHFVMDYSKAPGQGWSYQGYTANPYKYPQDQRLNGGRSSVFTRVIAGKTFLYMTGMYYQPLAVYRFNSATDGETAIPAGLFATKGISSIAGSPSGEWVWRDTNGNGAFDAGEYSQPASPKADTSSSAMFVDSQGTVWNVNGTNGKIRSFPVQGLDANGSLIYGYNNAVETAMPAIMTEITRLEYDPASDTMIIGGLTTDRPSGEGVGTELLRFDNWSTGGNLVPVLRILLPTGSGRQNSMAVAGNYAFTVGMNPSTVHVYDLNSGTEVGTMDARNELGGLGWVDIPYGIRAYKRSNGEYAVLVEEDGNGKVLIYRWTPATTAPAAPTSLSATAVSSSRVQLIWTDNSSNDRGFTIECATDSGFSQNLTSAVVGKNVTSYTVAGLAAGTTYYFRVRATNAVGDSANSASASVATLAAGTITKLTGTPIGSVGDASSSVATAFDGDVNNFFDGSISSGAWAGLDLGYAKGVTSIKYSPRSGFVSRMVNGYFQVSNVADFSTATTIYTITATPTDGQLTAQNVSVSGTWRYIRYIGPSGGFTSLAEMEAWGIALVSPPAAPSAVTIEAIGSSQIIVSWTDNSSDETGFVIDRATDAGFTANLVTSTVGADVTTYQATGLAGVGPTYYFRVRAINTAGASANTNTVSVDMLPTAPSSLKATTASSTQINLAWTDNSGNETAFVIDRATDSGFTANLVTSTVGANVTTYAATNLVMATTYYFRVRATNAAGFSTNTTSAVAVTRFSVKLTGTIIGTSGSYADSGNTKEKVFDGNLTTFFNASGSWGAWVGLDMGSPQAITSVKYAPRNGWASRMTNGNFQVSNVADFSTATTIYTITAAPVEGQLTAQNVSVSGDWRYIRYVSPTDGYCDMAEMEVWSDILLPAAPSGLSVTAASSSQINLGWKDNSTDETGFKIDRATNAGFTANLVTNTVGANVTTYSAAGLAASTTYYFRVRATNISGDSGNSATAAVSAAPTGITLKAASDSGLAGDNLTDLNNSTAAKKLSFTVVGTVAGATVSLYAGSTLIGSAVAAGSTTTVTTDGITTLADGNYSITARQTVPGLSSSAASPALTVSIDTVVPVVSGIMVNDGAAQRSMVKSLTVTFSEPVSLSAGAMVLQLHGGGTVNNVTLLTSNPSGDGKTYVVSFLGSAVVGGSLADGIYDVVVKAGLSQDIAANALATDNVFVFHRLFGDADGNRTIDTLDLLAFKSALGSSSGSFAYRWWMDVDGSGSINTLDLLQFKQRLGKSLVL